MIRSKRNREHTHFVATMKPSQPLVKQAEAAFAYYATSSPTARSRFACISPLRQCRTYYDAPSQSRPSSLLSHQAGRLSQKYPAHSWRTFRRRYAKTVEEAKSRQKTGVCSAALWKCSFQTFPHSFTLYSPSAPLLLTDSVS